MVVVVVVVVDVVVVVVVDVDVDVDVVAVVVAVAAVVVAVVVAVVCCCFLLFSCVRLLTKLFPALPQTLPDPSGRRPRRRKTRKGRLDQVLAPRNGGI